MEYHLKIQEKYQNLTKSEQKVANYILHEGKQIIHQTMLDVKEKTKVGDATIIRFCQKINFSGFTELKIAIAREYFNEKTILVKDNNLYTLILQSLVDALKATYSLLNQEVLAQVVAVLHQVRHVYIFGVSSSGTTSIELENMLLRVGVHAKSIVDSHLQAHVASIMSSEDLLIVVSLSGKTKDIYDALLIAKRNGAFTVAITSHPQSPIGQVADRVLQSAVEEFLDGGSLAGKISQLYICEILVLGYETQHNIDVLDLREKGLRAILNKLMIN
ncbi:MurR/RpiR family transcriptional regulator [Entomospira entomophila]|uniref:MurR/RpiR family transcriptional regulator n=1 Tax=Entomospira entomophila TaxID=2719988 RepID=A0A968KSV5_9SPIO|nr:MurR/RpiR family transcriptional regulator [Entomospira entomophilus]NIZ40757.1 MurR/RpiR family transcriptional regulator [Entomospira entomophilus]WDI34970.1 MurR/RpiR family transcriptional regulator [Entomospira entomophilus]